MIYRIAVIQDKSIRYSPGKRQIENYCRKVTVIWVSFFIFNGNLSIWTIFSGSDILWSVYNGGISYLLMGILFAVEFMVRKKVQKTIPKAIPLTAVKKKSRNLSDVLCYEGAWNDNKYRTWADFLEGTAKLRAQIETVKSDKWLLYCDDYWFFLLAFTSLLQCKKEVLLSANTGASYIAEIRNTDTGTIPFLTDLEFSNDSKPENTFFISAMLENTADNIKGIERELPPINGDETSIIMFTSGSTGKPKAVKQRLIEFENDNLFILSKWGEEFPDRKLCSTVNQHHIYGLLFSILLPFTSGIPFRRQRILFPEEFEKLIDVKYMIISVPAFLKRAVEIEKSENLNLVSPWIFTSGGLLDFDTAQKTSRVFGFWPVEIYGSTETSGIAWRSSDKGSQWTVFDNARISCNKEGCLLIQSPYIKEPAGFETADLAEIIDEEHFILKGRLDSFVKIEEKRVSLLEMENRILESGLAADVCIIAMEERRQYLAAAVVFNDNGKEKFSCLEKQKINNFWKEYLLQYFDNTVIPKKWRYLETLPVNTQGKKNKEEIKSLFTSDGMSVIEKTDNSVILEFTILGTSPYFDGHFPEFQILPAVGQIDLIMKCASKHFGTGICLSHIKRIKFTGLIRPDAHLFIKIEKNDKLITFKIYSPEKNKTYSYGTIIISEVS
ncbi:MAG: AMP-binding protein [Treponema sp.]|jgi:acyl-CoA synthetase (AMP-forming)/AMP-acid ligase II|nr:AMP-binding protein [Treponema sp.]